MELHVFKFLTVIFLGYLVSARAWADSSIAVQDGLNIRTLTAITIRSDLERREVNFAPRHNCEHHYADHLSLLNGASARYAKTLVNFKLPALALEDIESHVESIECSETAIAIGFSHLHVLGRARADWDAMLNSFIVVSSHPGCNAEGARAPFVVSEINYSTEGLSAVLSIRRIEWSDAYDSMIVQFGMTGSSDQYSAEGLRFHDRLRRRQPAASSTAEASAAATSTVDYPALPTSTPSATTSNHNISFSNTDPSIFSYKHTGVTNGIEVTETITIGCKECSLTGTLEIIEGTLTVGSSTDVIDQAAHFIESGYFKAVANGFNGHIELDTSLQLSVSQSFEKVIAVITLPGFQIPDVAAIGPQLNAKIHGNFEIDAGLDFTYGFDFSIPDDSSIMFDVGNVTQSSEAGFSNATIAATPFTANSSDISLSLGLGLTAELLLGISILGDVGSMHAGIFIDLPSLEVIISEASNVNQKCEAATPTSNLDSPQADVFTKLLHIEPLATVDVGLEIGAQLTFAGFQTSIGTQTDLAATTFSLPTACLLWDGSKGAFVSPTASVTGSTAGQTVGNLTTDKKANFGTHGVDNPLGQGLVSWTAGMLTSVLLVVLLL